MCFFLFNSCSRAIVPENTCHSRESFSGAIALRNWLENEICVRAATDCAAFRRLEMRRLGVVLRAALILDWSCDCCCGCACACRAWYGLRWETGRSADSFLFCALRLRSHVPRTEFPIASALVEVHTQYVCQTIVHGGVVHRTIIQETERLFIRRGRHSCRQSARWSV